MAMKTDENFYFFFLIEENTISVLCVDVMSFSVITISTVPKQ